MNIYVKLSKVQTELKAPKGQFNAFGKYKYRNCEDILQALKPLLKENDLSIIINDSLEMIGNRIYIKAEVKLIDNETKEIITTQAYAREEENKKGMDGSQVTGASSSYARKYALNGMFAIDDNKDSDTTNNGNNDNKSEENKKVPSKKENKPQNSDFSKYMNFIAKNENKYQTEIKEYLTNKNIDLLENLNFDQAKELGYIIKELVEKEKIDE